MAAEIKVPVLPESVQDATIATWHKQPGEPVSRDENLVDIETDKVVLEVVAPADGSLEKIMKAEGETVSAQEVVALFVEGAAAAPAASTTAQVEAPVAPAPAAQVASEEAVDADGFSPAVRRLMSEKNISPANIKGTGKNGRVTSEDVLKAANNTAQIAEVVNLPVGARIEKRVPMTRLRARIAERLLHAQESAAILTTFNEIDMQPVMDLRKKYKDAFEKTHGVKLGFMSFFTKAVVEALKRFPAVNASIDENDIVYHGFQDIGIAVSSPRGLVVPILRNAEALSMADIEKQIRAFGTKAQDGKLGIEEMTGGTFTISNGGTFGSLMSTPILNPPQSGILGMHKIEDRAVVVNGEVVVRPMMYVALSYDHRIIDGAESVRFLVTIKEAIEDPSRLLLEV